MKFGSIQITRKAKKGKCRHCEKSLKVGMYHAIVTIRIGPAKGRTKHRFINWRLHIDCLGVWLIAQLVARQDRRKPAGRPKGSGLGLSKEDKNRRLALLKRRIRIFQEIGACAPKAKELGQFFLRVIEVNQELERVGGIAIPNRRTTLNLEDINKKLLYGSRVR